MTSQKGIHKNILKQNKNNKRLTCDSLKWKVEKSATVGTESLHITVKSWNISGGLYPRILT